MSQNHYFIVGGAGFIGSHFCDRLLASPENHVSIYDSFASGQRWHVQAHAKDPRFKVFEGDVKDLKALTAAMQGHSTVIHLASNPDIAAAMVNPLIDFWEGTYLTQNVIEAARQSGVKQILYASGSGVYGDLGYQEAGEDHSPMVPVSTYGASKLAGETLISSYCHMYEMRGYCFRFGNVVGPRQTHGVGYDFIRRLLKNPSELKMMGNGTQSKSYIHVEDVVSAVLLAPQREKAIFNTYNVATGDYITVNEIANICLDILGLKVDNVNIIREDSPRGWKGDVPIVRLNTDRIKALGWTCSRSSAQALTDSIQAMLAEVRDQQPTR